jgi:1-acyl-sn-glycerol-3-phosphate acyltransferase
VDGTVTNGTSASRAFKTPREEPRESARLRDLLDFSDQLSPIEQWQIGFLRKSFLHGTALDRGIRLAQRYVGSTWIEECSKNLRHVYGTDRLPTWDPKKSYIVVANHRSFFDLFVVAGYLMKRKLPLRIMFPVRSKFFYDQRLGFVVNAVMSMFSMYPPVFRERQRAALNLASLDETVRLLRTGGMFVGLHPEGTRNKGDDPYDLLPAQGGVGRVIQGAKVDVIPVFINGLGNDLPRQVLSNFTKKGGPITIVFGAPVDFGDMLEQPASPRLHRRISEHALEEIKKLGEEERAIRATLR